MSATTYADASATGHARSRPAMRLRSLARPRPELAALLLVAAVLNLWALSRNGFANTYYAATVRSMASSWHDFLFASFDPSGVMTVDKPPLALWVQALSVKLFGYSSLSMLVPQALMGIASVALVYDLTCRRFGRLAGGAAGLVLALTPITVAVSRHNNPDALLVLCSVAALWCIVRGLEDGRTRWLVLAGVCVGLGFETKMAVALMVVPGIAAAWLWVAPRGRLAAVRQLLAGGTAMAVAGLAWPVLMWLTPASQRPWISGTSDNSIWSLIVGYNGVGRIDGQAGGPAGAGGGGGGGGLFGGASGPLRLFNEALGGQGGWLLGFAAVAGIAVLAASRLRRSDARSGWLLAVGGAALTTAVAFSFAQGIFHPYYVSLLAPFSAALVGAGVAQLAGAEIAARLLAPIAIAAGVVAEIAILRDNPGELSWVPAVLIAGGAIAIAALAWLGERRLRAIVVASVLGLLLIAPAAWSAQTLGHVTSGTFPAGGPGSAAFTGGPGGGGPAAGGFGTRGTPPGLRTQGDGSANVPALPGAGTTGGPGAAAGGTGLQAPTPSAGGIGGGMFGGDGAQLTGVLSYVHAHGGGTIAVSSQSGAASQIIASGADVAGIGGFSGRESDVSISWLADAVRDGRIRWVLADAGGGGMRNDGRTGSTTVMAAVAATCKKVTVTSGGATTTLYDCQGYADALQALVT